MKVEVVFALPDRQELVTIGVDPGTTVGQAIEQSGIAERFPGCCLDELPSGIWGHPVERSRPVRDGDRIEIYRELSLEPREARRRLALAGRTMGASDPSP